jgi:serine/threonine protein kinase
MSDDTLTIDRFLDLVRRSGLVEQPRLAAAVAAWPDHSLPLPEDLVTGLVDAGLLTGWQVEQLRKGRHRGFMLGKYRLLGLLGRGGMSSVYLAEHSTLRNKVAIKVLPRNRVEQTSYLARFEREARTSARLNHPNIVRAFDLDTSGEIHFIAMEYVAGTDLHAKVKEEGPLPVRDALEYVRQTALGLQHAHEEGLVHRDIKPANLILDARGTVKILDLGLALAHEDDTSLTKTHDEKVLGTADYLAPEQARDSHTADARSDIYALGCTLHYLLVGTPPFAEGKLAQRIQAHLRTPAPNLLDRRPDLPPAIVELYFRMMEKHPDARPQTAREVADALAAWLASDASATGRPPPPRRQPPRRSAAAGGSGGQPPAGSGGPSRSSTPVDSPQPGTVAAPPPLHAADSRMASGAGGSSPSPPASSVGPSSHVSSGVGLRPGPSSIRASGSEVDPDVFAFPTTAPRAAEPTATAATRSAPRQAAAAARARAAPAAAETPTAPAPGRSPPRSLLGLPPIAWMAIAGGMVVATIGVAAWVALSRPRAAVSPGAGADIEVNAAAGDKPGERAVDTSASRGQASTRPGRAPSPRRPKEPPGKRPPSRLDNLETLGETAPDAAPAPPPDAVPALAP